jgi:hypothetical protein
LAAKEAILSLFFGSRNSRVIMQKRNHASNRHYLVLVVALFFFLCSIYLLTYNVEFMVNDEYQMFDVVGSLVDFGDVKYDISLLHKWERHKTFGQGESTLYPLPVSDTEPVYSYLGTILYRLTGIIPNLGVVHVLWLANSILTAAACVVMFFYVRLLGYRDLVGLWGALALGLGTILWPYTQTYMREPLALLLLLLGAYLWEKARSGGWGYLVAGAFVFVLTFFTKEPIVMALPGFAFILLPYRPGITQKRWFRLALNGILGTLFVFPLVLIYTDIIPMLLPNPVHLVGSYTLSSRYAQTALHTYLLSPGGSIWGTSPILLLALPGAWIRLRKQQSRYVWVMVLSVLGFAVGHALLSGPHWFGGPLWPPRFLMLIIPFVLICALPTIDAILKRPLEPVWGISIVALTIYSLWWQFNGVALSWYEFGRNLPPEAHELSSWGPGLNQVRYFRPVVMTPIWLEHGPSFTWWRSGVAAWPLVIGAFAILWGGMLSRTPTLSRLRYKVAFAVLPVLFFGVVLAMLPLFYERDPEFLGDKPSLHNIAAVLDAEEQPGDVLILNNPTYHHFFLNYAGFDEVRVVSVPYSPGERGSFEQIPEIISDNVDALVENNVPILIDDLSKQRDRLWLLMETGPFLPWSIRPMERFMAQYYYLLRELQTDPPDPTVRLLEYSTVHAPNPAVPPESTTSFVFGESIHLNGFTLPAGTAFAPGDALPVTLYWQTDDIIIQDYHVALFLANSDNSVVAQGMDSAPHAGFMPTNTWETDTVIQDNRALRLPDDLSPGEYFLWVRLYTRHNGNLEYPLVTGGMVIDDSIAVLPVTIRIE